MILGIDVGKRYGLCKLREGELPEVDYVDKQGLSNVMYGIDNSLEPVLVVYERINAQPRFGVKACFSFGYELGWLEALLTRAAVSKIDIVSPLKWKNRLHVHSKQDAINFVTARWNRQMIIPNRGRVENHNMADAVCIAVYGSLIREGYL